MQTDLINTVLVDDDPRALNRMKILLKNFTEIIILEQFVDSTEAIEYILHNKPDLVFLDVEMSGKTGLEVADKINKNLLHTKIIFVTSYDHYAIKAIKTEVFDYLLKPVSISDLKESIERYQTRVGSNLTNREFDIIRLISQGFNSREIGERLSISRHTVDTYRRLILEKTVCKNTAELVMYASKKNLV